MLTDSVKDRVCCDDFWRIFWKHVMSIPKGLEKTLFNFLRVALDLEVSRDLIPETWDLRHGT